MRAVGKKLRDRLPKLSDKKAILKAPELVQLFEQLKKMPKTNRAKFGSEVNALKSELEQLVKKDLSHSVLPGPIDVTAPFDVNVEPSYRPTLLPAKNASTHPITAGTQTVLNIFLRMGFTAVESRELDDDYHMFGSLNFPKGHPAREDYDTFTTDEELIAPAHTSTMQNRVLRAYRKNLNMGQPIAVVLPGRVFRNEDVDARHEHTFHQLEGVYVGSGINVGHLLATFKAFLEEYFSQSIEIKTQPFYFPFTEPSLELALSCPFCKKAGCSVCSYTGWIELLGMGLIHPNVLTEAGIDPAKYTGFAWGCGIERLVMMKYGIEDIRHFHSANLQFLRQFV